MTQDDDESEYYSYTEEEALESNSPTCANDFKSDYEQQSSPERGFKLTGTKDLEQSLAVIESSQDRVTLNAR